MRNCEHVQFKRQSSIRNMHKKMPSLSHPLFAAMSLEVHVIAARPFLGALNLFDASVALVVLK
jgi:hypothetical protein